MPTQTLTQAGGTHGFTCDCGWFESFGWPSSQHARLRGDQHEAEHDSGTPIPSEHDVLAAVFDAVDLVTQPDAGAGSADFAVDGTLDDGWSTADTVGDCTFTVVGGRLEIDIPGGVSHDPGTANGTAGMDAPRVERAQADADFDVYVRFDSDPFTAQPLSGQGILVRTGSGSIRADIYAQSGASTSSSRTYVKHGSTVAAVTHPQSGTPGHLRMTRTGDDYLFRGSYDGTTWETLASFTHAGAVTHVGVYAYNAGGDPQPYVGRVAYVHMSATPPVVASEANIIRAAILTEPFDNLDAWLDESANGGTAAAAGTLTLTCTTTDRSTGRIRTTVNYPENVGVTFRTQVPSSVSNLFLGIVLRGQSVGAVDWAGQYAPPAAVVSELSGAISNVRMLRTGGVASTGADGALWTYFHDAVDGELPIPVGSWVRFRFEAVGPFVRYRAWADGASEPTTWTTVEDHAVVGEGRIGFAWSHNDGQAVTGSVDLDDLTVYEVTTEDEVVVLTGRQLNGEGDFLEVADV